MSDSPESDIESGDEEEVFRNFDEEAHAIIQHETLPRKSGDRYMLNYSAYKNWKKANTKSLSESEENNLVVYFKELKEVKNFKPSTIWSIWSMLKKTMNTKDNIDIASFQNLKNIVKQNSKGYKPKKALAFTMENVMNFINSAPDLIYLAAKVSVEFYF